MLLQLLQNQQILEAILSEMEELGEDYELIEEAAEVPPGFIRFHGEKSCPCYGCVMLRGTKGLGQN